MASTISGATMFGITCRSMIRRPPAPRARADSMNGKPITSSTAPRTTRAKAGRITIPIAIIAFAAVRAEQAGDHDREDDPGQREHDVDDAASARVSRIPL